MDTDQNNSVGIDLTDLTTMASDTVWLDGHGDPFTITTSPDSYTVPWNLTDITITTPPVSGKIELRGEDADIEINGESVVSMLKDIRDRLNILQVSAEMEQEWDELRALREQYEAKLTECREKSRAWAALKQAG